MIKTILIASCFCMFFITSALASDRCIKYEPELVELKGVIKKATFPGPPNYESIKDGDIPETYWILHLMKPICVQGDPSDELNSESEKNVTSIQLVILNGYKKYKHLLGKNIVVNGKLSHAISGHHHTPILLEVQNMK